MEDDIHIKKFVYSDDCPNTIFYFMSKEMKNKINLN